MASLDHTIYSIIRYLVLLKESLTLETVPSLGAAAAQDLALLGQPASEFAKLRLPGPSEPSGPAEVW